MPTDSFRVALRDLASARGLDVAPTVADACADTGWDLTDSGCLVGRDEPWLLAGLRAAAGDPDPVARARAAIAGVAGNDAPVALFANEAAAALRLAAVSGPGALLVVDEALGGTGASEVARCTFAQVTAERLGGVGMLVVEPTVAAADLTRVLEVAAAAGVSVVFDERRTACRAAAASVAAARVAAGGRGPDMVLFGRSLAAGLPFAAIVGDADATGIDAVTAGVVAVIAEQMLRAPVAAELERTAAEIVAAV
ncbi:MAG: hypothetical protein KDC48_10115, partial [Planctomycetes bacterium]|nr:hypothetical protein [Planctomycetota bacterium]